MASWLTSWMKIWVEGSLRARLSTISFPIAPTPMKPIELYESMVLAECELDGCCWVGLIPLRSSASSVKFYGGHGMYKQ